MSENLATYQKTVRLAAITLDEAKPIRSALDERIEQAVNGLASAEPLLEITSRTDPGGNFCAQASANGYSITVSTRCGQDTQFKDGVRKTFISYTISAQSSMRSLDRAASVSRELKTTLRVLGAIGFAVVVFVLTDLLASKLGFTLLRLHVLVMVGAVAFGGWIGNRFGTFMGDKLEARAYARAETGGTLPQLDMLWHKLERQLDGLLSSYERV